MRIALRALGLVTALGVGKTENARRLAAGERGLDTYISLLDGSSVPFGMVTAPLVDVPPDLAIYESRNVALALTALAEIDAEIRAALKRYGPERIGVVMGSSTSGSEAGLQALETAPTPDSLPEGYDFVQQELGTVSESIARHYRLLGPALTIATACSSSAKALASARRLLFQDLADAVIVGGADSFTRMTVNGFHSLLALDREPCRPFDVSRAGINIGEGAAVFLMERGEAGVMLKGIGESSDAHNITAPRPDGYGAVLAMTRALEDASLLPADIDYVNLHATGTVLNDAMEAKAVHAVFGSHKICSGSKGQVGHTLGAAGAVEAGFCWLTLAAQLKDGCVPPHVGCSVVDPALPEVALAGVGTSLGRRVRSAMSSSYAFGGSNVSIVMSAPE
jgi:3-oxoacyl-[acyl-carrier-protein] synthase-1